MSLIVIFFLENLLVVLSFYSPFPSSIHCHCAVHKQTSTRKLDGVSDVFSRHRSKSENFNCRFACWCMWCCPLSVCYRWYFWLRMAIWLGADSNMDEHKVFFLVRFRLTYDFHVSLSTLVLTKIRKYHPPLVSEKQMRHFQLGQSFVCNSYNTHSRYVYLYLFMVVWWCNNTFRTHNNCSKMGRKCMRLAKAALSWKMSMATVSRNKAYDVLVQLECIQ